MRLSPCERGRLSLFAGQAISRFDKSDYTER
jgi:hypothetical protein